MLVDILGCLKDRNTRQKKKRKPVEIAVANASTSFWSAMMTHLNLALVSTLSYSERFPAFPGPQL